MMWMIQFQSAPGLEAGRCLGRAACAVEFAEKFQSAPGLEAGRCRRVAVAYRHPTRFNPRPA